MHPAPRPNRRPNRADSSEIARTLVILAVLFALVPLEVAVFARFVWAISHPDAFFSGGPLPLRLPNAW
jgi:hypothetical protein